MTTATRCECGKARYATRQTAERDLHFIAAVSYRPRIPVRVYLADCGWWHLTSASFDQYRARLYQQEAA